MPTASGGMTADEKREADRLARREAVYNIIATIETPEWFQAQADAYVAGWEAHKAGQADGTVKRYASFEVWYPAGEEFEVKVGRKTIKVDGGKARSYGVSDALKARGIGSANVMKFGLFEGRAGMAYGVYPEYGS